MDKNTFIENIVRAFYERATQDVIIGYQFQKIIDFERHIPKIILFWQFQLLQKSNSFNLPSIDLEYPAEGFNLIKVHRPLHIHRGEVGRWATLFKNVLNEQQEKYKKNFKATDTNFTCDQIFILMADWNKKITLFEEKFLESPLFFGGTGSTIN